MAPKDVAGLIAEYLGIFNVDARRCRQVFPPSRNLVWRCRIDDFSEPIFLKIQGGPHPSNTIRHEVQVLEMLKRTSLLAIPHVLGHGYLPNDGLGFSILSGLPGQPLKKVLLAHRQTWPKALRGVIAWLETLHSTEPKPIESLLPAMNLTARFLPSFNPASAGLMACELIQNPSHAKFARRVLDHPKLLRPAATQACPIHGSFTAFNILAEKSKVTGFLDFESTRIGDPMEDCGSLAYYLLQEISADAARQWLVLARDKWGPEMIYARAIPFILWFAVSRASSESVRWQALQKVIREFLL